MPNMYVPSECNNIQEQARTAKMVSFFNTLEEKDKDIVITMTESLVERNKGNKKNERRHSPPVVLHQSLAMCAY
jgi:hypothetical protein